MRGRYRVALFGGRHSHRSSCRTAGIGPQLRHQQTRKFAGGMSPRKDVDWSFLAFQSWYLEKSGERPRNASVHTDCAHQMQMFQTAAKMLTFSY